MSGSHYDDGQRISHSFGLFDYGGAGDATAIPVPRGKTRCRIEDIILSAAEVFTTGGKVEVGTAGDPNRYAELLIGTLADTEGLNVTDPDNELFDIGHGGKGVVDVSASGDNITQLEVVFTITGGIPTGQAWTTIVITWW